MSADHVCELIPPCECIMRARLERANGRTLLTVALNEDEAMRFDWRNSNERERFEEGLAPSDLCASEEARLRRSVRIEG